jgi:hypothetical protein
VFGSPSERQVKSLKVAPVGSDSFVVLSSPPPYDEERFCGKFGTV